MELRPGDPFPWIHQRTTCWPSFALDSMAGRYLVLCFFGVSVDPQDEAENRVFDRMPGVRIFWDFDQAVCKKCGVLAGEADPESEPAALRRMWIVVDPTLHVLATFPFQDGEGARERVFRFLRRLRPPDNFAGFEIPAPVLVLPNVFEPGLCRHLIELYDADGGTDSGVMRNDGGVIDHSFKSRKDFTIDDQDLSESCNAGSFAASCRKSASSFS